MITYPFFVLIGVHLIEAKILNFLLAHEVVLHSALEVVDLELLAAFWHQLVLVETGVVPDCMLFALVEVIQRKRPFVRCCHYCSVPSCAVS